MTVVKSKILPFKIFKAVKMCCNRTKANFTFKTFKMTQLKNKSKKQKHS